MPRGYESHDRCNGLHVHEGGSQGLLPVRVSAILAVPVALKAQTGGTGAIEGTVTDPSGSVVARATVTAANTLTGVKTASITTKAGYYVIPLLKPGTYDLSVTASGFATLTQEHVVVDALATVAVNPKLTIGAATQSITVTTETTMLMTEDVKLGRSRQ